MTTPSPDYPQAVAFLAQRLLQQVVGHLEAQGVSVPSLQFCAPGLQTVVNADGWNCSGDCVPGQVTVTLAQVYQGAPGAPTGQPVNTPASQRTAAFAVEIWRNTPGLGPSGQSPTVAAINTSAVDPLAGSMVDAFALFVALDRIRQECPTGLFVVDDGITVGPIVPVGPVGATAGTRGIVYIDLATVHS